MKREKILVFSILVLLLLLLWSRNLVGMVEIDDCHQGGSGVEMQLLSQESGISNIGQKLFCSLEAKLDLFNIGLSMAMFCGRGTVPVNREKSR